MTPLDDARAAEVLRDGDTDVLGRMPWSSNATFLVNLTLDGDEMLAIYKPQRGERPLWDFPRGTLCHREVAAFEVSRALGWDIVPDTVLRDGPAGIGMMQRFVEHDPEEHYFTLLAEHGDAFRRMAAFDVVINNTDRKGGHCLRAARRRPHLRHRPRPLVPHAVEAPHGHLGLRGRAGSAPTTSADLRRLLDDVCGGALGDTLYGLLDRFELDALRARTEHLLATGVLPEPDRDYHSYPWPTI